MNKFYSVLALLFLVSAVSFAEGHKIFYADGPKDKKVLSLTFDDGPAPNTKRVLEILEKYKIKATFFMEGGKIAEYPAMAKEVLNAGHEVGIHLYDHPNFYAYKKNDSKELLVREIEKTQAAAKKAMDIKPELLRMPYGYVKPWVEEVAKQYDLTLINWSFGTDWNKMTKDEMLKAYSSHIKPGAIFLMHDSGKKDKPMLNMLGAFIEEIQKKGYKIVTISELLELKRQ